MGRPAVRDFTDGMLGDDRAARHPDLATEFCRAS
jgi:hypothetical protein